MAEQRRHHASPHSAPETNGPSRHEAQEGEKEPDETPQKTVLTGMSWAKAGMPIIDGRNQRRIPGTLTFGDGVNTYPAGGIPLPISAATGGMGLMRHLDYMEITDTSNAGATTLTVPIYVFDKAHMTLRLFHPGGAGGVASEDATEYGAADVPLITTIGIVAVGI